MSEKNVQRVTRKKRPTAIQVPILSAGRDDRVVATAMVNVRKRENRNKERQTQYHTVRFLKEWDDGVFRYRCL